MNVRKGRKGYGPAQRSRSDLPNAHLGYRRCVWAKYAHRCHALAERHPFRIGWAAPCPKLKPTGCYKVLWDDLRTEAVIHGDYLRFVADDFTFNQEAAQ